MGRTNASKPLQLCLHLLAKPVSAQSALLLQVDPDIGQCFVFRPFGQQRIVGRLAIQTGTPKVKTGRQAIDMPAALAR